MASRKKLPIPTTKAKQRAVLDVLIPELGHILRHLRRLRAQLHNRKARRGRRSAPPTYTQRRKVIHLHRTTNLSNQEIGIKLNISNGRVSEILRGPRK